MSRFKTLPALLLATLMAGGLSGCATSSEDQAALQKARDDAERARMESQQLRQELDRERERANRMEESFNKKQRKGR